MPRATADFVHQPVGVLTSHATLVPKKSLAESLSARGLSTAYSVAVKRHHWIEAVRGCELRQLQMEMPGIMKENINKTQLFHFWRYFRFSIWYMAWQRVNISFLGWDWLGPSHFFGSGRSVGIPASRLRPLCYQPVGWPVGARHRHQSSVFLGQMTLTSPWWCPRHTSPDSIRQWKGDMWKKDEGQQGQQTSVLPTGKKEQPFSVRSKFLQYMQVPNMLFTERHNGPRSMGATNTSNSSQRAMGNHSGIKHRPVWTCKHALCQSMCTIPCLLLAMHWLWHQFIFLFEWVHFRGRNQFIVVGPSFLSSPKKYQYWWWK